jgi:hypothetical protein
MKKYTKEDEAYLIERYTASPTSETVDMLADDFGVTRRSIIGKLATLRVYQSRPSYKPKYGEAPVSKEQLVETLANLYELDVEKLRGLETAKKDSLLYLVQKLQEITPT